MPRSPSRPSPVLRSAGRSILACRSILAGWSILAFRSILDRGSIAACLGLALAAGCAGPPSEPVRADPSASRTPPPAAASTATTRSPRRAEPSKEPQLGVEVGAHAAFVRRLDVAPGRGLAVTASDDKTARVWELASGRLRHVLRPSVGDGEIGRLYGVAIHPTEPLVAVGGTTGHDAGSHRILLFSLDSGQLVRAFDARGGHVKKLAWSADGTVLAAAYAGDNAVRAFDLEGNPLFLQALSSPAFGLAASTDGRIAASALDGTIIVFSARGGRTAPVASYRAPRSDPVGLSFSPDGNRLLVGFRIPKQPPIIIDSATGRQLATLASHPVEIGHQFSVAWSSDGRTVAAGGSGYTAARRFPVFIHDAASGRVIAQHDVGDDSIYDLAALPDGAFAFASGDGSWGVVDGRELRLQVGSTRPDLKGPEHLRLSSDGRRIGWMHAWGREPMTFDLDKRIASAARTGTATTALAPPRLAGPFGGSHWQDTAQPRIGGKAFALDPSELSRALTSLPDGRGAILGTSHRLIRVGSDGAVVWQQRNANEVRAVNATADGRMVVTGMSDGTLRWWRASDGALLATLLAMGDGRWVIWTPEGYYDAGAGADRLVGWSVNRADAPVADHFSLNRFRERFSRPDVIDRVLRDATPVAGLEPGLVAPATAAAGSKSAVQFPPVIDTAGPARVSPDNASLQIPVAVRASGEAEVEVRVDGRPVVTEPAAPVGGNAPTVVTIAAPAASSLVQVLAKDRTGVSEPIGFIVETPTAAAAQPGAASRVESTASRVEPSAASRVEPSAASRVEPTAPPRVEPTVVSRAEPTTGFRVESGAGRDPPSPPPTAAYSTPVLRPAAQTAPADAVRVAAAAPAAVPPSPSGGVTQVAIAPPTLPGPGGGIPPGPVPARPPAQGPKLHVLAIGVSEYQRPEYRLGLAAKDARDFAGAMRSQSGRLYRQVEARTLTDGQATRTAVLDGLKWLSDSVSSGDIGMLFIAGHGINTTSNEYYFLPYDGNHERLKQTGLPEAAIRDTLGRMRGKALFFVDTCYGGNVVGNFHTASRELARMANDLAAAENGVIVFASSSGRQLSEEDDRWGNGAFTLALLAGLSGRADLTRSGRVTFKALDYYVSEEVNRLTDGRQTPVTIAPIGVPDFAIARSGTT